MEKISMTLSNEFTVEFNKIDLIEIAAFFSNFLLKPQVSHHKILQKKKLKSFPNLSKTSIELHLHIFFIQNYYSCDQNKLYEVVESFYLSLLHSTY